MKPIEPKKFTLRLCGHDVEIVVTHTSHPEELTSKTSEIIECFGFEEIEDDICQNNEMHGDFTIWEYLTIDGKTVQFELGGEWRILCDFSLFRRIFSWWYNHASTEAVEEFEVDSEMYQGEMEIIEEKFASGEYQKVIDLSSGIPQIGYRVLVEDKKENSTSGASKPSSSAVSK